MTAPPKRLTGGQIDRLLINRYGRPPRKTPALSAARDYLGGRATSIQVAASRHGISHQAVSRHIRRLLRLARADALQAECVMVATLIPLEHLTALRRWVDERGGDVEC